MRSEMVVASVARSGVGRLVDDQMVIDADLVKAVKGLARAKPWRGERKERIAKFRAAHAALADALEIPAPKLIIDGDDDADSVHSEALPARELYCGAITLRGRLSVVTFLWAWGRATGSDNAMRLAVNLFKRCFPLSFSRADLSGPFVRRR